MKSKITLIAVLATFLGLAFIGKTTEYKVDKTQSKLAWLGKKVTGEHSGNINISDGKVVLDGTKLVGGSFDIDMTSITNTDITDESYKQKLLGHLKSDDFFSTEKFPKSTFVITKVTPGAAGQYTVKGNLTIKGITKEVEFPATVKIAGNQVTANAKIKIDRTKYDIKYGSGSFFDNLGDKAINDEFEMDVNLIAKK